MTILRETLIRQHQQALAKIKTVEDLARYVMSYEGFENAILLSLLERIDARATATGEAVDYDLILWVLQNDDQVEFDGEPPFARYVSVVPDYDEDDQDGCPFCGL